VSTPEEEAEELEDELKADEDIEGLVLEEPPELESL
jgi:hypothetical protein